MVDTFFHVGAMVLPIELNPTTHSLVLLAVVVSSLTMLLLLRPHRFKATLRLDVLGGVSNAVALLFLTIANDPNNTTTGRIAASEQQVLLAVVVAIELSTIVWFLVEIYRTARDKVHLVVKTAGKTALQIGRSISVHASRLGTRRESAIEEAARRAVAHSE